MIDITTEFSFNLFDIIVITVLFTVAVIAAYRGFVKELLSIWVWLAAALTTLFFVGDVADLMLPFLGTPFAAIIFAMLSTLFLSLITFSAVNTRVIGKYVRPGAEVGRLDNVVGFFFGALKGWFIIVLGYILVIITYGTNESDYPDWVKNSYTLPAVEDTSAFVARRMPTYLTIPTTELSAAQEANGDEEDATTILTIPPSSIQENVNPALE